MKVPGNLHNTAPPRNWQIDVVYFPSDRIQSSHNHGFVLLLVEIPAGSFGLDPSKEGI
jgi:hypothetical protein